MPTVRRLYLYLMALVSLMALMVGLINVSAGLVRLWLNARPMQITATELASSGLGRWLIVVLISAPAWALHWFTANRTARQMTMVGAEERAAPARKAYFYAGRFGALVALIVQAGLLLYDLLLRGLGEEGIAGGWPLGPLGLAAGALIAWLFWVYLYLAARHDGDVGHEPGAGAGWRRAYDYLGAFLGTALLAAGAAGFLQVVLNVLGRMALTFSGVPGLTTWREGLAASLAALIVGIPVAMGHWRRADWAAADDQTGDEVNSLGRKLLLYAMLLVGAGGTVLSMAYLVMIVMLLMLGQPVDDLPGLWAGTIAPLLAVLPVALVIWWSFGRTVRIDLEWAGETPDAAALRHLYFYLMAGILLAAFWWGLQQVLAVALFLAFGLEPVEALAAPEARNTVSIAVALFVAAGPAWWWHWRRSQYWAEVQGPFGIAERQSTMRKFYLYGVVVAAAAVVIVTLGIVIYQAPALLLGPHVQADLIAALIQLGVAVGLALLWWLGYGLVMRDDARVLGAAAATEAMPGAIDWDAEAWDPSAGDEPVAPPALSQASDETETVVPYQAVPEPLPAPELPPVRTADDPAGREVAARHYDRADLAAARASYSGSRAGGAGAGSPEQVETAAEAAARGARPRVAVVDGGTGVLGAALLKALAAQYPDLQLWPIGLNDAAQEAMAAAPNGAALPAMTVPGDVLAQSAAIVGPSDMLVPGGLKGEMPPELAAAIAASPARKILLPAADPRLRWAGAPAWSTERWIRQVVAEVGRIVASEEQGPDTTGQEGRPAPDRPDVTNR